MEITFTCPHCGEVSLIDETFVGQSGPCRACDTMVTVAPVVATTNRRAVLPTVGAFFRWCNDYLGYVVIGIFLVGVLIAFLSPAFDDGRLASRRMSSGNNLKQIALAVHNYHDLFKQFPRAYWLAADGKRTLSWRVALLPFLEKQEHFDSIDVSEVWDHEANRSIRNKVIEPYRFRGGDESRATDTCYMVITGPGTLFEEGKDICFDDCADGPSNTVLAVEVMNSGVHWAQPKDLDIRTMIFRINAGGPSGIGSPWKDGAQVAMADGSVKFLSNKTLESTLRAMITRAGGEAIDRDD